MLKFLIDEDMPRSTAKILKSRGYEVLAGIVIAHFPNEMPTFELNNQIIKAFDTISETDFNGNLGSFSD